MIAFIGSVFSPYYARARRRAVGALADPCDHCAVNVALYDLHRGKKRWAMTERGRGLLRRTAQSLQIGPSGWRWQDGALLIDIDEITVPWPAPLRGCVSVQPTSWADRTFVLDREGRHRWSPIAPVARVEVDLVHPALGWSGTGYVDCNRGDVPLEHSFTSWQWSRAALPGHGCAVAYDVQHRDGGALSLALQFDAAGPCQAVVPPPLAPLKSAGWGLARTARCDAAGQAAVAHTLEDAPFYARSLVRSQWHGRTVTAVHESLSLQRFDTRWVQGLLPFRMPRAGWGGSKHTDPADAGSR